VPYRRFNKATARFFSELYTDIVRRRPKSESEWVYNDILLFALTLGVKKFELERDWLEDVLSIRLERSQEESRSVAQTYMDLIKDNFENTSNHQPLMIVMKNSLDLAIGNTESLNSTYQSLTQREFPYSKVAFLNLICLKAFDIIVLSKGLIDIQRQKAIEKFVVKFNKRITQIAIALWWLLLLLTVAASASFLIYYLRLSPIEAERITRILTLLPFLGFGGLTIPVVVYRNR